MFIFRLPLYQAYHIHCPDCMYKVTRTMKLLLWSSQNISQKLMIFVAKTIFTFKYRFCVCDESKRWGR